MAEEDNEFLDLVGGLRGQLEEQILLDRYAAQDFRKIVVGEFVVVRVPVGAGALDVAGVETLSKFRALSSGLSTRNVQRREVVERSAANEPAPVGL